MNDDTKPDLIWSFVENNRHLEIVEFAAPRKINVIFEKPLASTYKDALRIEAIANKAGITKPLTPHVLRHTFSILWIHKG